MTDLAKALLDAVGDNDPEASVSHWCSTGYPPLDEAISGSLRGGMPVGRIVEMYGPESSGKTAIATQVMIAAQRAGGVAVFLDHEKSFDARLAEELGLDLTPGHWVYKRPDTFEQSVDMAILIGQTVRKRDLIDLDAPIVIVFDSLASMTPQSKLYDATEKKKKEDNREERTTTSLTMHDSLALAKATSSCFDVLAHHCGKLNMLMLFLNQEREKPGVMFGDPTTTPGGKAPKFYCSVRIQLGKSMIKEGGKIIGQTVRARVVKNKVSGPFREAEWNFMFREDGAGYFDTTGGMIDYLKDKGIIESAGAYLVWEGKKLYKSALVKKIEDEGKFDELLALLP